ncbi:hypothetical protein ACFSQW_19360 [Sphingobacterium tabacisoli]|uniref:Uncharacterized protein n=1 Tax=Sphingobacterium tabacisoli TaxID=2044855 RepID=A0ABW5L6M7_9SPHI
MRTLLVSNYSLIAKGAWAMTMVMAALGTLASYTISRLLERKKK